VLKETVVNLQREQADVLAHIQTQAISDEDIAEIEAFYSDIRLRHDNPSFKVKRQIIESQYVRGKLAIDKDEKVILCQISSRTATAISCPNIAFIK
jgi:hypothetical protein